MRVTILNLVWDTRAATPEATLARFTTLTGWAEALVSGGADAVTAVTVVQRFRCDARLAVRGVQYEFVASGGSPRPPTWFAGDPTLHAAVVRSAPDVMHVNGMDHPAAIRRLRRALPGRCAMVVQDHGGFDPAAVSAPRRAWIRWGLGAASALLVATPPQSDAFRASGLSPHGLPIDDVMEGSTTMRADAARTAHSPLALLWVGRLNANKDPLTVLRGFERFASSRPDVTLRFVFQDSALEQPLREAIDRNPALTTRVELLGAMPPDRLQEVYAASDIFVLGSHHEGSGYAALEAMACGVVPVLTDIPPFRWLTDGGGAGALWPVGDAAALAGALDAVASRPLEPQRRQARARFDAHFSWDAIGRRALAIYLARSRT